MVRNDPLAIPKKKIEFGELRLGRIAKKNLEDILNTGWASYGPKCREFEERWGHLFGYKYNIALSSGTDACIQACLSLRTRFDGGEIIVPALSFIATANAVRIAGFTPRFVDIKRETRNIDEDKIEEAINEKTVAIMVVHTMGRPCAMDKIVEIAKRRNLEVIEDCCEAHGAKYKGKFVGTWGAMGCFSFYVAHLICCGEGGMLSTNRSTLNDTVNSTKCHGRSGIYFDHPLFGINSKMNDLEASLGLEGVENFWDTFAKRSNVVSRIRLALSDYKNVAWFSEEDSGNTNCPHAFSLTLKEEGKLNILTDALEDAGIHWKRNFGCIPTQHGAFSSMGYELGDFPEAEYVGDNGIHIGTHAYLTSKDVDYIIDILQDVLEKLR